MKRASVADPTPVTIPADYAERTAAVLAAFYREAETDPTILERIPFGVTLVLVPDDDPELATIEIEIGQMALRQGRDVYFRHVRIADLPTPPDDDDVSLPAGLRRTLFRPDGSVESVTVLDEEGEWRPLGER
jgi:hypothetical protein